MAYNVGKVRKYKNYVGEIISKDGVYIFTSEDTTDNIKDGDMVIFRAEEIHNIKIAHFVQKVTVTNGKEISQKTLVPKNRE